MLVRYWITFDGLSSANALSLGCGVTARSKEDALEIVRVQVFDNGNFRVSGIIENVDISTITDLHVRPNMGNVLMRGVWFPLGYV